MNRDFFRPEVMRAKQSSWLGTVSLAQPVLAWVVTATALLAVAGMVAFLMFAEYSQRSRVPGTLIPDRGMSVVIAPSAGVVGRITVNEGDVVRADQQVGLIYVPRSVATGQEVGQEIEKSLVVQRKSVTQANMSRRDELDAKERGFREKWSAARLEMSQLDKEISTRREQVELAEELVSRYRTVLEQQYVSLVQLRQQEQAVLESRIAQQALERQRTVLLREISELEQGLSEIAAKRGELDATERHDLAALDQEKLKQELDAQVLLRAPVAGLVSNRSAEPGQAVETGQSVMAILPSASTLQAQLMLPSRAIGFVKPGNVVLLRYEAFPYQKFGLQRGRVLRISRSSVAGAKMAGSAGDFQGGDRSYYRVVVALDSQSVRAYGKDERLRPGMQLEADILTERRRLYEWLIEPLYAVRGFAE